MKLRIDRITPLSLDPSPTLQVGKGAVDRITPLSLDPSPTLQVGKGRRRPGLGVSGLMRWVGLALVAIVFVSCRQDMHDQPRYEPLEASEIFADGAASRQFVEGTVARGFLGEDVGFETGLDESGVFVAEFPVPVDLALLERGRSRYDVFCSPCHDRLGEGRGMIVRRGFKQPASFHEERLLEAQPGYFVNIMTNGFGQMSSYAPQLRPDDRWAVAAYIQALQLSRQVPAAALSDDDRARLAGPEADQDEAAEAAEGGHS